MSKKYEEVDLSGDQGYQIMVVNIKYGGRIINPRIRERPDMVVLDVPKGILDTMNDEQKFKDNVETFAYKTITAKYGAEVTYCQVFLPENK